MRKIAILKVTLFFVEVLALGFAVLALVASAYIQYPEVVPLPLALLAIVAAMACAGGSCIIAAALMREVEDAERAYNKVPVMKSNRRR